MRALRERTGELEVLGLGGEALEAVGMRSLVPQREVAVGGLVEVLSSLPALLRAYTTLRRGLVRARPDVAVLVDSPDLNLPLAAVARRHAIPVFYYVAPQVWAWRMGRVRKLRRRVSCVGAILPFEEELLRQFGVPARFVGHPLVERMAALQRESRPERLACELGLSPDRPILSLLPGSRRNELHGNLPVMLQTARLLHRLQPELQILLLVAPTLAGARLELPACVRAVRGQTQALMALSTCLLVAPGTATVEAALLGVPHVVVHRTNPLSFELFRRLARVPSTSLINLIAGMAIVPERIQEAARPAALAALLAPLISDPDARERMRTELRAATRRLGPPDASRRAAEAVLEVAKSG